MPSIPDSAVPLATALRHRGVPVADVVALIERFAASPDPLRELRRWVSESEDAGELSHPAARVVQFGIGGAVRRGLSYDVYDPDAELTDDGGVIDANGNVWVSPGYEPLKK